MQLPEKYKESFDVSSEGPSSGVTIVTPDEAPSLETSKFFLYFSGSRIPTNESLFYCYTVISVSYKHTDSNMATPSSPMLPLGVIPKPPINPAQRSL
jgi:hypothetical protein